MIKSEDLFEVPSCRMRIKSGGQNDENDNFSRAHIGKVADADTDVEDEEEAPGIVASLRAKTLALPAQSVSIITEAPGKLVSLWRSTAKPSFQSVAHMVHGSMMIQNILQSMAPRSNTSSNTAATTDDEVIQSLSDKSDIENIDNSACDGKVGSLNVKKVEMKKQS